jgi:phospholipid/cholesterol/gamma-HCH transport system substrate-binding protein
MEEITIRISKKTLRFGGIVLEAICLAWIGWHIWSSGLLLPKYSLRIYLPNASGINVGAPVRLDGIEVGTVETVKLADAPVNSDRRIEVNLRILKRHQGEIRADSSAMLQTEGLLGGQFVAIQRGFTGPPIEPGGEIRVPSSGTASSKGIVDLLERAAKCIQDEKRSSEDKAKIPAK